MPRPALKPLHLEMLELLTGHFRVQAICTAAALGISDLLKDGPKGSEELGRATGAQPQALHRLLWDWGLPPELA